MNVRALLVALASFATCVGLFVAASGPLRGLFGDVIVVVMLVAAVAGVGVGTARSRVGGVLALAFAIEAVQTLDLVGPDAHWLAHAVLGATFDPLDLVAYTAGACAALGLERWWAHSGGLVSRQSRVTSS